MDVEMPELDGLAAMKQILAGPPPKPIMIMVSGHTQRGTETTIKALSLGAVDFVSKSSSFAAEDLGHVDSELSEKLRYWARQPALTASRPETRRTPLAAARGRPRLRRPLPSRAAAIAARQGRPGRRGLLDRRTADAGRLPAQRSAARRADGDRPAHARPVHRQPGQPAAQRDRSRCPRGRTPHGPAGRLGDDHPGRRRWRSSPARAGGLSSSG